MGNWWCTRCQSYKDSWAEHQGYKSDETYRRDIKCYSCDSSSLIYTDSQKSRYKELVKERTSIPGYVEEVERFSTWWSNNIATAVVYYDGYYWVYLLAYDPVYSSSRPAVFPESYDCSFWGDSSRGRKGHNNLLNARSEASWLRDELVSSYGKYSSNPILLIHPYCDYSNSFDTFVTEPYVTKKYSTSYLKPLDIVRTYTTKLGFGFYHVGVYLGKIDGDFRVCQFTSKKNNTTIDPWSDFVEGAVDGYHPIIPFKDYKDISRQVVWAKDNGFRKGNYSLHHRNCEHFANMTVYGINFSKQLEEEKGRLGVKTTIESSVIGVGGGIIAGFSAALAVPTFGLSLIPAAGAVATSVTGIVCNAEDHDALNNGKTSVNLRDEIRDTNNRLGKKNDWETKKYENKYLQEVPPKESCRVM